jgi:hypothetical protein
MLRRDKERGLINSHSKSAVVLKENGDLSLISGYSSQIKASENGKISNISIENLEKTNKKKIEANDIIINNHKLNPKLFEFTDMRNVLDSENSVVGNFTTSGTVLVKAWDDTFKKYVLIRRPVRLAMFSPALNTATIPEGLDIDNNIIPEIDELNELEELGEEAELEEEEG